MNTPQDWAAAINGLSDDVHELARSKGWYEDQEKSLDAIAAKLALVHSEVSECVECLRDGDERLRFADSGKPEGLPAEMADIIIRTLDLAGWLGVDIGRAVLVKHEYNATRPHRHGGKRL